MEVKFSDLEMEKALIASQTPTQLLKFAGKGKPMFRNFYLSPDFKVLYWESDQSRGNPRQLTIQSIVEIKFGQRTEKFQRNKRPDLEHLSFSIVYKYTTGDIETLDIVCKDEKEFRRWTNMIIGLFDKKVSKEIFDRAINSIQGIRTSSPSTATIESGSQSGTFSSQSGKVNTRMTSATTVQRGPSSSTSPAKNQEVQSISEALKSQFEAQNDLLVAGWGEWGQTGQQHFDSIDTPTIVNTLLGKGVDRVTFGWSHALIALETGDLTSCGNRLGTGFDLDTNSPSVVQMKSNAQVVAISSGMFHNIALFETGDLYSWGCGIEGQLGHGNFDDKNLPAKVEFQGKKISAIACGSQSSFAITESGELFSWGSANKGALGHEEYLDEESPKFVRSLVGKLRVVQISCGEAHALAVTQSGPYSWGWNSCGQLGLGHVNDCSVPQQIEALKGMEIMSISCGAAHSCAVVYIPFFDAQSVYVWGSNNFGQLGVGDTHNILNRPTVANQIKDDNIVQIACGSFHTMALSNQGLVFATGLNNYGQLMLGRSNVKQISTFTRVQALDGKKIRKISCGYFNSAALSARQYVESNEVTECQVCQEKFSLINRKHHCMNCGGLVCAKCSQKKSAILKYGITQPVRVCDPCHDKLSREK